MVSNEDIQAMVRLNVDMKSIGEVAERFGLATHVLRHWESAGLLTPTRDGERRRYTDADENQVAAIMLGKEAGFALPEIRAMLSARTAKTRHEVMARHRDALADRITKAQAAMAMLDDALTCPHDDLMTCPTFQEHLGLPRSSSSTGSVPAPAR
jgi:MerR family transcriptional regulator, copper efflux regulator